MKRATIFITLIFTLSLIAGSVFAYGPCARGGQAKGFAKNCPGYGGQNFAELTPEQQEQLTSLRQKFFDDTADLRIELVSKHKEMDILLRTSAPDKEKLNQIVKEMSALQSDMEVKRIDFILEAKKIAPDFEFGFKGKHGRFGKGGKFKGKGCKGAGQGCPGQEYKGAAKGCQGSGQGCQGKGQGCQGQRQGGCPYSN
ncbi:MAG: periplasmic heavy metal sensor [Desulfobacteraceae bacterium]|nr:MAG: periplasmic heavy metal sensor [Desulfobacteraceae bacterium]